MPAATLDHEDREIATQKEAEADQRYQRRARLIRRDRAALQTERRAERRAEQRAVRRAARAEYQRRRVLLRGNHRDGHRGDRQHAGHHHHHADLDDFTPHWRSHRRPHDHHLRRG